MVPPGRIEEHASSSGPGEYLLSVDAALQLYADDLGRMGAWENTTVIACHPPSTHTFRTRSSSSLTWKSP